MFFFPIKAGFMFMSQYLDLYYQEKLKAATFLCNQGIKSL